MVDEYVSPRLFHVLLAEDIQANATLAILRLKRQGHTVEWFPDGKQALEAYMKGGFDLILMDVMMPEMDGWTATAKIRDREKYTGEHIPILALTASVMNDDYRKCLSVGMDVVEAKPLDFNRLFASMEQVVPEGKGKPNVSQKFNIELPVDMDFTPIEGVVNVRRALKVWGGAPVYAKALGSFVAQHGNDGGEISRLLSLDSESYEPVRAMAHALKGVAGNLYIEGVAGLASEIDTDLKVGRINVARSRVDDLKRMLDSACTAIGRLRMPDQSAVAPPLAHSAESLSQLFSSLVQALDELNPDVVEPILDELARYVRAGDLAPIRTELEAFRFEEAKVEATALANKLAAIEER
ncbi:response regulator [Chitinimonas sp. PSY-7]|uniref:response regulator n=1 Tax=Chitinimonas sp. PSY-7 TaxID=3459088 RepID=UPI00403FDDA7